ncbi:MAG: hypothetical protein R2848_18415 [Thermomicrobiales bacterium]
MLPDETVTTFLNIRGLLFPASYLFFTTRKGTHMSLDQFKAAVQHDRDRSQKETELVRAGEFRKR